MVYVKCETPSYLQQQMRTGGWLHTEAQESGQRGLLSAAEPQLLSAAALVPAATLHVKNYVSWLSPLGRLHAATNKHVESPRAKWFIS